METGVSQILSYLRKYVIFLRPIYVLLLFNSWSSYNETIFRLTNICMCKSMKL